MNREPDSPSVMKNPYGVSSISNASIVILGVAPSAVPDNDISILSGAPPPQIGFI